MKLLKSTTENLILIIKYGMSRSFLVTTLLSTIVWIGAPSIVKVFTNEPEIISIAVTYIRLIVIIYPLVSIALTSGRILQGLGLGLPLLITTTIRVLGVSAPLALIFNYIYHKPIEWIWYAMMVSTVVAVTVSTTWLWNALKKRMIIA